MLPNEKFLTSLSGDHTVLGPSDVVLTGDVYTPVKLVEGGVTRYETLCNTPSVVNLDVYFHDLGSSPPLSPCWNYRNFRFLNYRFFGLYLYRYR